MLKLTTTSNLVPNNNSNWTTPITNWSPIAVYSDPTVNCYPVPNCQYPTLIITAICSVCKKWVGDQFIVKSGLAYCSRKCLKQVKIDEVCRKLDR